MSIWFLPFVCLAAHDRKFLRWTSIPTHTSNCYCLPGKAGGLPTLFTRPDSKSQNENCCRGRGGWCRSGRGCYDLRYISRCTCPGLNDCLFLPGCTALSSLAHQLNPAPYPADVDAVALGHRRCGIAGLAALLDHAGLELCAVFAPDQCRAACVVCGVFHRLLHCGFTVRWTQSSPHTPYSSI